MKNYTDEELEQISSNQLIYPKNRKEITDEVSKFLLSKGIDPEDDGISSELVHIDYWCSASEVAEDLADLLLHGREEKEELKHQLKEIAIENLQDALWKIDELK